MALQVQDILDSYGRFKQDVSNVDSDVFVEWCEFIQYFIYGKLKAQDPERFMSETVYYAVTSPDTFSLPSDLMDIRQTGCGFFELTDAAITYDTQTANFTLEATLTGGTSGATALITADDDDGTTGTLTVKNVHGVFVDDEIITDGSGGSATVNGAPAYTINTKNKLAETGFGSGEEGYYFTSSDVVFTNAKEKSFVFRYIPQVFSLAALDDYFTLDGTVSGKVLVEDRHKEYLVKAVDVMYEQWDDNAGAESISDFRMVRALGGVLDTFKRTSMVSQMDNPINNY